MGPGSNIEPRSASAITASALGIPSAHRRVPSRGSTAMSTSGGVPSPICSPLWSIGASSFSPSPITTTPSMWIVCRTACMPSTAAWSAASLSPRPIQRAQPRAAASVTRTSSSARLRSGVLLMASDPIPCPAMPDAPRWGLTLPFAGVPLAATEPLVRRAEAAGWDDVWTGDTNGPDGFTPLALAAAWTERMRLGTGVVSAFTRGPAVLAQHAAALADASDGRFVLGIGASSDVIVERWNGMRFEKPLTRVRETVAALRPVLAGERGPGGFKLDVPPAARVPIYVAALRDRMLRLAGEIADGTWVNFLPLSAAGHVVGTIAPPPGHDVVCRFFCIPQPPGQGLTVARFLFAGYATVPVYEAFFRGLGWGDALDPMVAAWRSGDRKGAAALAPEELLREIFVFGSPPQMRARLEEFAAAGITTLCLMPVCAPDELPGLIDAFL